MSGAIHGQAVRGTVADPIPELQLRPMELPVGEREVALTKLAIARAGRRKGMPPLAPEQKQIAHTAFLAGWNACRRHYAEVTRGETLRLLYDAEPDTLSVGMRVVASGGGARRDG